MVVFFALFCDYLRPALWLDVLTCGSAWWTLSTNQHILANSGARRRGVARTCRRPASATRPTRRSSLPRRLLTDLGYPPGASQALTRTSAQGVEGKDSDVFVAEFVVDHRPPGLSELRGGRGVGQAARRRTPAALRNGRWLTWIGAMKNSTPTAGSGWSTRTRHIAPIHLPSAEDAMA